MAQGKPGHGTMTISFETGPSGALEMTQENLKKVTAVGFSPELDTVALLVERLPGEPGTDSYEVIDLKPEKMGDLPDIGKGGLKLIIMMLEAITGHLFQTVGDPDNKSMSVYRRVDFQKRLEVFEASQKA